MDMILNETPIKTSKNFGINNILITDIKLTDKINKFGNVNILNNNEKVIINSNVKNQYLKYNLSDKLTDEIINKANLKLNIDIESNSVNKNDIILDFNFDDKNTTLIDNILINAKEGSTTSIIIFYKTNSEEGEFYHNGLLKVNLEKNAKLKVVVINTLNNYSNNFYVFNNNLEENSNLEHVILDFGCKNSISNYYSNVAGDNAKNDLNTIYLGRENNVFDINYILELYGKETNANIEVQGALMDKSKKNYKGTIDFKQGSKKAKGNENENCMLLSNTAKSKSLPMLLCHEDDVEGNHSMSAGRLQDSDLFYIMSRGIDKKSAIKLLVRSKFNCIIDKIENSKIKEMILDEIDRRLV